MIQLRHPRRTRAAGSTSLTAAERAASLRGILDLQLYDESELRSYKVTISQPKTLELQTFSSARFYKRDYADNLPKTTADQRYHLGRRARASLCSSEREAPALCCPLAVARRKQHSGENVAQCSKFKQEMHTRHEFNIPVMLMGGC